MNKEQVLDKQQASDRQQELARKQVLDDTIKLINYTTSQLHHESLVNQQTHQQQRQKQVGNNGSWMSWAEEHYIEAGLLSLLLLVGVIVAVRFVVTSIRGRRVTNTTGAAEGLGNGQSFTDSEGPRSSSMSRSGSEELNGGRGVTAGEPGQSVMEGQGADRGAHRHSFQGQPNGPDEVPSGHPDHGPTAGHSGQSVIDPEGPRSSSMSRSGSEEFHSTNSAPSFATAEESVSEDFGGNSI